jgi:serine/threonine protein kinase
MAEPQARQPMPPHVDRAIALLASGPLRLDHAGVFETPKTAAELEADIAHALRVPTLNRLHAAEVVDGHAVVRATVELRLVLHHHRAPIVVEGETITHDTRQFIITLSLTAARKVGTTAAVSALKSNVGEDSVPVLRPLFFQHSEQICQHVHQGATCGHGPNCCRAQSVAEMSAPASHRFLVSGFGCDTLVGTSYKKSADPETGLCPIVHVPVGGCYPTKGLCRAVVEQRMQTRVCDEFHAEGKCRYWNNCVKIHIDTTVVGAYFGSTSCGNPQGHDAGCPLSHGVPPELVPRSPWTRTPTPIRVRGVRYSGHTLVCVRDPGTAARTKVDLREIADTIGGAMAVADSSWINSVCVRGGCDFSCRFVHLVPRSHVGLAQIQRQTPPLPIDKLALGATIVDRATEVHEATDAMADDASVDDAAIATLQTDDEASPVFALQRRHSECDDGEGPTPPRLKAILSVFPTVNESLMEVTSVVPPARFDEGQDCVALPDKVRAGLERHLNRCQPRRRCHAALTAAISDANKTRRIWQACGSEPRRVFFSGALFVGPESFAEVYIGVREETHMPVAVKVYDNATAQTLTKESETDGGIFEELRILLHSNVHTGLLQYVTHFVQDMDGGIGSQNRMFFLVTHLMNGSLSELVTHWEKKGTSLADRLTMARRITYGALSVVHELHTIPDAEGWKMVHGNLNLHNLMINYSGRVCVVDVRVSRLLSDIAWMASRVAPELQSAGFLSQEVMRGETCAMTTADDIFAIGRVALALIIPPKQLRGHLVRGVMPESVLYDAEALTSTLTPHSLACLTDFATWLTQEVPNNRPTAAEAMNHPFFWSEGECIEFLAALANEWQQVHRKKSEDWKAANEYLRKPWSSSSLPPVAANWVGNLRTSAVRAGVFTIQSSPPTCYA